MCLAVPGKILEIYEQDGLRMGKLEFGGTIRKACLQYVPEAQVNHYALVHVGFALATIEEDEAERQLALLRAIGDPYAEWEET
jgi:hydrogenase expression/formation protein HypC